MIRPFLLKNEDGYLTIVAALVILALLTVIGISASRVASTEVTMARNEVVYKRNFYLAEGAALEAADRLAKNGNLKDNSEAWMEMVTGNLDTDSLRYYWDNSTAAGDTVIPEPSEVDLGHTHFLVGHDGVAHGSSLDMSKPTIHAIAIYGRCVWEGSAIVKMGYRAAY
jgi:type II secretory pathway pseudopilin PulG